MQGNFETASKILAKTSYLGSCPNLTRLANSKVPGARTEQNNSKHVLFASDEASKKCGNILVIAHHVNSLPFLYVVKYMNFR